MKHLIEALRPRRQNDPANAEQIQQLERVIRTVLPDELRALLEYANGAWIPRVSIPSADCPNVPGGGIGGNALFGVEEILQAREDYAGRVSSDLLGFANDSFGNLLCIGLRGPRAGKVYFWDHENDVPGQLALGMGADEAQPHANEHHVADSLRQFLFLFRNED